MKTRRLQLTLLSLVCLLTLFAFAAQAEVLPFDLEVGYRWASVSGNQDMYRSQIDESSGFLVRTFSLNTGGTDSSLFDRFHVDASDVGVGPASFLRIDSEKTGVYRLNLNYRRSNAYSALPEFANPLLSSGVIPGQHTYDRTRNLFDADLEFLQSERFRPFVGFSTNHYSGPGTSTYHVGQDEFLLDSNLKDVDREYRIGTGLNLGWIYGQVTQGWRNASTTEHLSLSPGAGNGNSPSPILGQQQTATAVSRTDKTNAKTPFTNAFLTAQFQGVRLIGNYVRFSADSDGRESEAVTGTFASFPLSRFFDGLSEQATSSAKNRTWRGGARAEYTFLSKYDFFAGYQRDHRELEGTALINSLYQQTLTFGGIDPRDIQTVLNAQSAMKRTEDYTNVGVSAKVIGPLAVRAEYRVTNLDVSVAPDLSEIVVPSPAGSQGGDYSRQIKTWDVDATVAQNGFFLGGAYRNDSADDPIFRTDFLHRDRLRLRGGWNGFGDKVRLGLVTENTNQDNDQPGIQFNSKMRQYSADAAYAPVKQLTLRASLSKFRADSDILYRLPQTFDTATSFNTENGKSKEGGVSLFFAPVTLDTDFARFENSGTNPFKIDRTHIRLGYDFKKRAGIIAEFDRDKYREALSLGDFNAQRFGVYLHLRP